HPRSGAHYAGDDAAAGAVHRPRKVRARQGAEGNEPPRPDGADGARAGGAVHRDHPHGPPEGRGPDRDGHERPPGPGPHAARQRRPIKEDQRDMAEQESGNKKTGWFKAFVGTVAGLCSGAAVMYITPLVDKAIKPAKPVANFKVERDGLNVRIQNLSNVRQGTW